jgi:hypothetical protein
MSAIFQRPLCDMGKAYDFAFRPILGDPLTGSGGPCDDRPRRVELFGAVTDPAAAQAEWRPYSLCPEHESQLRQCDERLRAKGPGSRFRTAEARSSPTPTAGRYRA